MVKQVKPTPPTEVKLDEPERQVTTLHSLSDVEKLLDQLEVDGVKGAEYHTLGNSTFRVSWPVEKAGIVSNASTAKKGRDE